LRLVFLYGQPASGKLTIGRALAARTGLPLFHNHLVVDAVASVFPFGSDTFIRLRERFWLEVIEEAAREARSLIFTFAPEPSMAPDFPSRVRTLIAEQGGETLFVGLSIDPAEQERRLTLGDRAAFGKLRAPEMLRALRPEFDRCMVAMPFPAISFDSGATTPDEAAEKIAAALEALG
jgi:hypothetical protein